VSNDQDGLREPFLNRWARQKQAQQKPPAKRPETSETDKPEPEVDQAELIAKLPKLEDLTAQSDITGFLQKGVPDALRNLALRQMWSLDPTIRDFVEVAENQWDFNTPGGVHGLFQEVAEGTDISVWMAQATQSVIAEPEAKTAATADHAGDAAQPRLDAEAGVEMADAAEPERHAHQRSEREPRLTPTVSVPGADGKGPATDQMSVVFPASPLRGEGAAPADMTAVPTDRPPRRRHGGALPTS
jgi:Protein of unknown function (DUF3306)